MRDNWQVQKWDGNRWVVVSAQSSKRAAADWVAQQPWKDTFRVLKAGAPGHQR